MPVTGDVVLFVDLGELSIEAFVTAAAVDSAGCGSVGGDGPEEIDDEPPAELINDITNQQIVKTHEYIRKLKRVNSWQTEDHTSIFDTDEFQLKLSILRFGPDLLCKTIFVKFNIFRILIFRNENQFSRLGNESNPSQYLPCHARK